MVTIVLLQRIHFKENQQFSKYGLYSYSEGKLTEKARANEFTGAPVLFVPGNSGSYKQARSFASVAVRKGLDNNWNHHLDYFTGECFRILKTLITLFAFLNYLSI